MHIKGVSVLSVYGFCCNCIYADNLHRFTFISMYIATTSSTSILCSAVCSIESLIWNATFCMGIICFILNFVSLIAGSWMYDYKLNFNVVCRLRTSSYHHPKFFCPSNWDRLRNTWLNKRLHYFYDGLSAYKNPLNCCQFLSSRN